MNAPPTSDPQIAEKVASTLELYAKIAGGVGALWVFLAKVAKPYQEWQRERMATQMRAVFAPEIAKMNALFEKEDGCADRLEAVVTEMQDLSARQASTFDDLDTLLDIVRDNRERHDEHDALMDTVFGLDRRIDPDRRKEIDSMLRELQERHTARRRGLEETSE